MKMEPEGASVRLYPMSAATSAAMSGTIERQGMDADLVTRAQQGDQGAFAHIASAVGPRFHGVAYGILRDRELAEEVTQQAIVDCWRSLPQLRDPSRFDGWAYRLVVNVCYSEARRAKRWLPNLAPASQADDSTADALTAVIDRDELERGFRRLSLDQRTVLVLHYYLDLQRRYRGGARDPGWHGQVTARRHPKRLRRSRLLHPGSRHSGSEDPLDRRAHPHLRSHRCHRQRPCRPVWVVADTSFEVSGRSR